MGPSDPFELLGLGPDATTDDVRDARRRLAKAHHPDRGGEADRMRSINQAADAALRAIGERTPRAARTPPAGRNERRERTTAGVVRDVPSFTVEALPAETFEALLVVTSWFGEVLDEEPPYRLDTYLYEPFDCWCRLEVVPDAGASTVSLAVAGIDGTAAPDILTVRDAWIAELNRIDWP